ncbi:MAG TPA: malto-oligosyltrehalose synthase [Terracidiphilus sp.]|jgi:(1->4)-alpha-D-glucan 1-alpha-D-glucosylmutase|nr:malto-oligosyltrehalose synthase [Terracidiphilus sp.]
MRRIPQSTYRLQLNAQFTFDDAAAIAGYLKDLGVTHVYCSPYLQAAPGSMHGYDVVDHQKVNEELGGEEGHRRFCAKLKELGLGQVLDIVPNHMAIGPLNKYWWDVLEDGPSSRYATWFDIDWNSDEVKLKNKVLIPVLGDQYGRVLAAGQIKVEEDNETFRFRYMDHLFPLSPRSLATLLQRSAEGLKDDVLGFIADSLARLPAPISTDPADVQDRHRDKTVIYGLLARTCRERKDICMAVADAVKSINSDIEALDDLLNQQNYRLAYWRTADQELGYRRFFDVNSLVGLRMERQHVFDATHARVLEWARTGVLDGIRVDHPDGLRDPQEYFNRLRARAPDAWIIGEKILEPGERLRESWPIDGTTGYDFLNVCNGLLVNGKGLREFSDIYRDFTGRSDNFEEMAHEKKINVEQEALGSDVNRLASLFVEICEANRDRRDYTRAEIRRAIREVAACFSIYRTYVVAERNEITEDDRREIEHAVSQAKTYRQDIDAGLFDFIGDVLTLQERGGLESEFLLRFQQFTSPVMAKGVEDTAYYCFNRMIGLNEVGGSPASDGLSLEQFHDYCARMQATHPLNMATLSTHDTKRGDDVRARLAALTEMPMRWKGAVQRWSKMNSRFRSKRFPDRNTEYFLYQTLIGAWPIDQARVRAYMLKAAREAKEQTTWTQQNKEFEDALHSFIEQILKSQEFVSDLETMVGRVKHAGHINSLTQTLLRYTAPGVPDTYQGGELWDYRLVDPDNRTPVDYELRLAVLKDLQSGLAAEEILRRKETGLPKLWVTHKALTLRREHPEWFGAAAEYQPLVVEGIKTAHVVAYSRAGRVAALAPRWPVTRGDSWAATTITLSDGRWSNILTGEAVNGGRLRMQVLLRHFPVALLVRDSG